MNIQFIHEHVGNISCDICHDIISLFIYSQNKDIISPFHITNDSNYVCDECFYDLNVIKDEKFLLYYYEDYIECEKGQHTHWFYIFDYNEKIKKKYIDFWIGI
jgi:hypothetical protein